MVVVSQVVLGERELSASTASMQVVEMSYIFSFARPSAGSIYAYAGVYARKYTVI